MADLGRAVMSWGWLLSELGYAEHREWDGGRRWSRGSMYIVIERSLDLSSTTHDRCRPGVNHLAFWSGSQDEVHRLVTGATKHGWRLMFADEHPYAGGTDHFAAYLENEDGYEVELVASARPASGTP